MEWGKILLVIIAAALIWLTFKSLRARPELLSKENLMKSFSTMGILGLLLIAFITFCIYLLRGS